MPIARGIWVRYPLRRKCAGGLGIDIDGRNVVIELLANGQAAADGLARPGDVVDAVDGTALAGQRLVDALVPGLPSYEVTAWRPDGGQLEAQANATLGPGTRAAAAARARDRATWAGRARAGHR